MAVTYASAQLNIEKLIQREILKEGTGRKRNRIFLAPEIISILEASKVD